MRKGGIRAPAYLTPYFRAERRHKGGLGSLLWEDVRAQEVRFAAVLRNCPLGGLHVLDVGCGRGDLLRYLRARGVFPGAYTGIEAEGAAAPSVRGDERTHCRILKADFVEAPEVLAVGADVIVFSGSLNLLSSWQFYRTLRIAWAATRKRLVFNFLDSPTLAGTPWLKWHRPRNVVAFARRAARTVVVDDGYEDGDCTVVMRR